MKILGSILCGFAALEFYNALGEVGDVRLYTIIVSFIFLIVGAILIYIGKKRK